MMLTNFASFKVRQLCSDFAVLTAIIIMVIVDLLIGVKTPKLIVPSEFAVSILCSYGYIFKLIICYPKRSYSPYANLFSVLINGAYSFGSLLLIGFNVVRFFKQINPFKTSFYKYNMKRIRI